MYPTSKTAVSPIATGPTESQNASTSKKYNSATTMKVLKATVKEGQ